LYKLSVSPPDIISNIAMEYLCSSPHITNVSKDEEEYQWTKRENENIELKIRPFILNEKFW
jgi:hypothetical protein